MSRLSSWLALAALMLAAPSTRALGGVIRHDRLDADYRAYAAEPQFAPVGSYSNGTLFGSFTLIAPQWALTAAHVADADVSNDTLRLGSITRQAVERIVPTGINGNPGWNGNINDGFDIALVRLDEPVTTIAPAKLYTSFQELGKQITQVGFGRSGTGKTGATISSGTKRAGDNVVDQFETFANGATGLRWDFDEPAPRVSPNSSGSAAALDLELLIAPGDSGGGSFIFENDQWYLAGVHSGTYNLYSYPNAASDVSTYGDGALVTRVAAYQQFIFNNIPDLAAALPEPSQLAVFAVAGLLVARRRRATGGER